MNRKIAGRLLSLFFAAGFCRAYCSVQRPAIASAPAPKYVAQARANLRTYYTWINATWTGNDTPYEVLRLSIEQKAKTGQSAVALMNAYQTQLAQQPHDFRAQFAYYYAAYRAAVLPGGLSAMDGQILLGNLYMAVVRQPHPRTYNYARLAFLCDATELPRPELIDIGLRLVHHDPADYYGTFDTISVLLSSRTAVDQEQALALAEGLAGRYPAKPNVYSRLASVHYQIWLRDKSSSEAALAIANYQKYLQFAPPDADYRSQAKTLIAQLQKGEG